MKLNSRFSQIVNLIIGIVVSIVLFIMTHNFSVQFFVSYIFFVVGGICSFLAAKNWSSGHRNSFPTKTVFLVITYLYWLLTAAIAFWIGVIINIHWKLFLLLELIPMGIAVLVIFLFQSVSAKFDAEDESMRARDMDINEITLRIKAIGEKAAGLNSPLNDVVRERITALEETFRYSDVLSSHYTAEMLQQIYNALTTIENELDAVLSIQPDEVTCLEGKISHLIMIIKNNDEACKASKR